MKSDIEMAGMVLPLKSSWTKFPAATGDKELVGIVDNKLFDRSNLKLYEI